MKKTDLKVLNTGDTFASQFSLSHIKICKWKKGLSDILQIFLNSTGL